MSESADEKAFKAAVEACRPGQGRALSGFTGTDQQTGKSSLLDELMHSYSAGQPGSSHILLKVWKLSRNLNCCALTRRRKRTGRRALLGDRIKHETLDDVEQRPVHAQSQICSDTRSSNLDRAIRSPKRSASTSNLWKRSGIGQGLTQIIDRGRPCSFTSSDRTEFGAHTQLAD